MRYIELLYLKKSSGYRTCDVGFFALVPSDEKVGNL